jgi:1-pyrroline-5-carboxylate dehydrogenase
MPNYDDLLKKLQDDLKRPRNIIDGKYVDTAKTTTIINPLDGTDMFTQPDTQVDEIKPFLDSLAKCPKSGRHNPTRFMDRGVNRYLMLGEVSRKASNALKDSDVADYFARLIQKVMPKSYAQAMAEVTVTGNFLANFSGDNVRYLAEGKSSPGDRAGQQPQDYFWPYGPVAIIAPFNFPLEIPALQLMGALYMGNKPLLKTARTVEPVLDQFILLLHYCGLPMEDVDLMHCSGSVMNELLKRGKDIIRLVQFTGSSKVAEEISLIMHGKVRIEDAGFDWKILGPDFKAKNIPYVAWQSDQCAYAASGNKCSAQSLLIAHTNWVKGGFFEEIEKLASTRNLKDLTVGPCLSVSTEVMLDHVKKLLTIPGAKLLFGGKELTGHCIPKNYGAILPTAVFVPLKEILRSKYFDLVTTEIFGPFQVVTEFSDKELPLVLEACERMKNHLTAGIVSNDALFIDEVLGKTVNGVTYYGDLARDTGAPQNHGFNPCGDPRGCIIGTKFGIQFTWAFSRVIIRDVGPIDYSAKLVQS